MNLQVPREKIVILGTGGTIAGLRRASLNPLDYASAQLSVDQLLQAVPDLVPLGYTLITEQVAQIDSKDMDVALWQRLLARCHHWLAQEDVAGVVVTHGTDTLEETAYFLHHVLAPTKPVVFTCAMRPADEPLADGPQNLRDALCVAAWPDARGVLLVSAGQIHGPLEVQKIHPTRIDAFSSGEAGALGRVELGQPHLLRDWPVPKGALSEPELQRLLSATPWPRVEMVMSHVSADGGVVRALLAASAALNGRPLKGLVVAGTGNGTVHQDLEAALLEAQSQGVRVVRATRCCMGTVISSASAQLPVAQGLSAVKARIALMVALQLASA